MTRKPTPGDLALIRRVPVTADVIRKVPAAHGETGALVRKVAEGTDTRITKLLSGTTTQMGDREAIFRISDGSIDDCKEIIDQKGLDLSVFKASGGPVLFDHNTEHVIGRADVWRGNDDATYAKVTFCPEGVSQKADEVCRQVKLGFIQCCSVGIDQIKSEPMNPAFPKGPKRFLASTLRELSIVVLPANRRAVVIDKGAAAAAVPTLEQAKADRMARVQALMQSINHTPAPTLEQAKADRMARVQALMQSVNHTPAPTRTAEQLRRRARAIAIANGFSPDDPRLPKLA